MEQNKIICPNCGAENEYGGICQYCGGTLVENASNIAVDNKSDAQPNFLNDNQFDFFEESFDKIDNVTISSINLDITNQLVREYREERGNSIFIKLQIPCSPYIIRNVRQGRAFDYSSPEDFLFMQKFNVGQMYVNDETYFTGHPTSMAIIINENRYNIPPAKIEKQKIETERNDSYRTSPLARRNVDRFPKIVLHLVCDAWIVYFKINRDILKSLCDIKERKLFTKIEFDDFKSMEITIPLGIEAQILYNRLFDGSAYINEIEKYIEKIKNKRKQVEIEEENKRKEADRKREEEGRRKKYEETIQNKIKFYKTLKILLVIFCGLLAVAMFFCFDRAVTLGEMMSHKYGNELEELESLRSDYSMYGIISFLAIPFWVGIAMNLPDEIMVRAKGVSRFF